MTNNMVKRMGIFIPLVAIFFCLGFASIFEKRAYFDVRPDIYEFRESYEFKSKIYRLGSDASFYLEKKIKKEISPELIIISALVVIAICTLFLSWFLTSLISCYFFAYKPGTYEVKTVYNGDWRELGGVLVSLNKPIGTITVSEKQSKKEEFTFNRSGGTLKKMIETQLNTGKNDFKLYTGEGKPRFALLLSSLFKAGRHPIRQIEYMEEGGIGSCDQIKKLDDLHNFGLAVLTDSDIKLGRRGEYFPSQEVLTVLFELYKQHEEDGKPKVRKFRIYTDFQKYDWERIKEFLDRFKQR